MIALNFSLYKSVIVTHSLCNFQKIHSCKAEILQKINYFSVHCYQIRKMRKFYQKINKLYFWYTWPMGFSWKLYLICIHRYSNFSAIIVIHSHRDKIYKLTKNKIPFMALPNNNSYHWKMYIVLATVSCTKTCAKGKQVTALGCPIKSQLHAANQDTLWICYNYQEIPWCQISGFQVYWKAMLNKPQILAKMGILWGSHRLA